MYGHFNEFGFRGFRQRAEISRSANFPIVESEEWTGPTFELAIESGQLVEASQVSVDAHFSLSNITRRSPPPCRRARAQPQGQWTGHRIKKRVCGPAARRMPFGFTSLSRKQQKRRRHHPRRPHRVTNSNTDLRGDRLEPGLREYNGLNMYCPSAIGTALAEVFG